MPKLRVTATILLWIPGSALFGLGWVLDGSGWSASHGFASNILAAATSGLLGLPIAAIVVQWILRQDADDRKRRQIIRLARKELTEMQRLLEADGIRNLKALERPVVNAASSMVSVRVVIQFTATFPDELRFEAIRQLADLTPLIAENLPTMAQDEWRFATVLRRWEILQINAVTPAEAEGFRLISDQQYQDLADNARKIADSHPTWLTNLMQDTSRLAAMLNSNGEEAAPQHEHQKAALIAKVCTDLDSLAGQITSRLRFYNSVVGASKHVESMSLH